MHQWDKKISQENKNFTYHVELNEENRRSAVKPTWRELCFTARK